MKLLGRQTESGKVGGLDGLNLFFGALLGANLGTLEKLPLYEYVKPILLLSGTVMVIRMVSTSKDRPRMLRLVGLYAVFLGGLSLIPGLRPKGMSIDDLHRLIATLGVWIELTPTHPDTAPLNEGRMQEP
jgi:hypothetical protein